MVLEIDREAVLRTTDRDDCLRDLVKYAEQLALLGAVDAARDLVTLRNRTQVRDLDERGLGRLDWAWRETGQWPEGYGEEAKSDARFAAMRQDYEEGEVEWGRLPKEKRRFDEIGLQACLLRDGKGEEFADATSGSDAMDKSARLVKALDISVRLMRANDGAPDVVEGRLVKKSKGEGDVSTMRGEDVDDDAWINIAHLDKRSADIASQIVARWHANWQIHCLMGAENLWPLYITGMLAKTMGLSRGDLEEKQSNIISTFSERLPKGHLPPILAGKPIKELLDIAQSHSQRTYQEDPDCSPGEREQFTLESWTMYKDGASEDEISKLEDRLDITLPEDYKEFLRITNGFSCDIDSGIYSSIMPDPGLYDVARVDWVWDRQWPAELLSLPREIEELGDFGSKKSNDDDTVEWDTALPLFDRLLEIGTRDMYSILLIPPECVEQVKAAYAVILERADQPSKEIVFAAMDRLAGSKDAFDKMEWCCCIIAKEPDWPAYSSFRSYLEHAASGSMQDIISQINALDKSSP